MDSERGETVRGLRAFSHWPKRSVLSAGALVVGLLSWLAYFALLRLPFEVKYKLALLFARVYARVFSPRRQRIRKNLTLIIPNLGQEQLDQRVEKNLRTLALNWAQLFSTDRPELDRVKRCTTGIEPLLAHYRSGGKTIVVFPHVGPINELMTAIAAYEVAVFMPAEAISPLLYKLMARQRCRYGDIQFAPVRRGEVLKRCAEKLVDGRIVILAMDILTKNGVPCLIGEEAIGRFPVGAIRLALKSGARLFPVFPSWGNDGKAQLMVGGPFELVKSGDLESDTVNNVRRLVAHYEPFLVENCANWWRLPLSDLEPAGKI